MRALLACALMASIAVNVQAKERIGICLKARTATGSEKAYLVHATHLSGIELNQATRSVTYEPFAYYAVVFWDQGQASIIKLDGHAAYLGIYPVDGVDQDGRAWEVSRSTGICY